VAASSTAGGSTTGATFRQTVLGLRFFGPDLPGGGKASGSVYMDFFSGGLQPGNNLFRLSLATLDLAWKNTTFTVGQDKPIIAPREPTSLAQVGVPPLTGAGNLWQWQPQARVEHRFSLGEGNEIRAQAGVFESYEAANNVPTPYTGTLGLWRPAYEARLEYSHSSGARRFEIAPGYHEGASRVAGQSVSSRGRFARLAGQGIFSGRVYGRVVYGTKPGWARNAATGIYHPAYRQRNTDSPWRRLGTGNAHGILAMVPPFFRRRRVRQSPRSGREFHRPQYCIRWKYDVEAGTEYSGIAGDLAGSDPLFDLRPEAEQSL
jgi:hypothetical protein